MVKKPAKNSVNADEKKENKKIIKIKESDQTNNSSREKNLRTTDKQSMIMEKNIPMEKNNPKKNKYKLLIILSVIVGFLIIIGVMFVVLKLRFTINDELNLIAQPLNYNFYVNNEENLKFEFNITVNNFRQCQAECNYGLIDLYTESIIYNNSKKFSHNEIFNVEYTLQMNKTGSGVSLYQFYAECNNIRTVVCRTNEEKRYKTSLISVNYGLNKIEEEMEDSLKENINELLANQKEFLINIEQNKELILKLFVNSYERTNLQKNLTTLIAISQNYEKLIANYINIWNEKNYRQLSIILNNNIVQRVTNSKFDSILLQQAIMTTIEEKNNINSNLKTYSSNIEQIRESAEFFAKDYPDNKIIATLHASTQNIYHIYSDIKKNSVFAISQTNISLNDYLNEKNNILELYDAIKSEGLFYFVIIDEISKEKNKKSSNANTTKEYDFSCADLRKTQEELIIENSISSGNLAGLKNNYNNSNIPDSELNTINNAKNQLIIISENRSRDILKNMNNTKKEILLNSFNGFQGLNQNLIQMYNYNKSLEEYYKYVSINATSFNSFILNNCRQIIADSNSTDAVKNTDEVKNNLKLFNYIDFYLTNINTEEQLFAQANSSPAKINIKYNSQINASPKKCCILNVCTFCCENNCNSKESSYPVLFIHGHSVDKDNTPESSMRAFTLIQKKMQDDGFINGGILDLTAEDTDMYNTYRLIENPITFTTTYYYTPYYSIGSYSIVALKSERVENYAIRLNEIINLVKKITGKDKVNIVAHSMGGLVARDYIQIFGAEDINKIILINTPNHGISGKIQKLCPLFGARKECEDLAEGSILLSNLNSKPMPPGLTIYNIRTTGCKMDNNKEGDGIVTVDSAYLSGATNYLINGSCKSDSKESLHTLVLDPNYYAETYKLVENILSN